MARTKAFNTEVALDAAVGVFREHGFAGTSAQMLTEAMHIGRQSLYDTFGGKWQLYCAALSRYVAGETATHIAMLQGGPKAIDGIARMLARVVADARQPCLGLNSIGEFADSRDELIKIRAPAGRTLRDAVLKKLTEAKREGDISPDLNPDHGVAFLLANVAAIRLAARGGAKQQELHALMELTIKALQ